MGPHKNLGKLSAMCKIFIVAGKLQFTQRRRYLNIRYIFHTKQYSSRNIDILEIKRLSQFTFSPPQKAMCNKKHQIRVSIHLLWHFELENFSFSKNVIHSYNKLENFIKRRHINVVLFSKQKYCRNLETLRESAPIYRTVKLLIWTLYQL